MRLQPRDAGDGRVTGFAAGAGFGAGLGVGAAVVFRVGFRTDAETGLGVGFGAAVGLGVGRGTRAATGLGVGRGFGAATALGFGIGEGPPPPDGHKSLCVSPAGRTELKAALVHKRKRLPDVSGYRLPVLRRDASLQASVPTLVQKARLQLMTT